MRPIPRQLWLVPILLALHNLEEAVSMRWFLGSGPTSVPGALGRFVGAPGFPQFLVAVGVVTVLPLLFLPMLLATRTAGAGRLALLLTQAVVFLNVFAHVASAVVARGYTPGLFTALCVNVPFPLYLALCSIRAGWLRPRALIPLVLGALVVHGPGLVGLLALSGWVVRG